MNIFKPQIRHFESEDVMIRDCVEMITEVAQESIANTGKFRVALAGGNTPKDLYKSLNTLPIDWSDIEVYQTDERIGKFNGNVLDVYNTDSPRINSNMISCSMSNASVGQNFYPMFNNSLIKHKSAGTSAKETKELLQPSLNYYNGLVDSLDDPKFDIVILGVGEDGHIASLFPNAPYLNQSLLLADNVIQTRTEDELRLSLTANTILNATSIIIYCVGGEKMKVVDEFVNGNLSITQFPIKLLYSHPNVNVFYSEE